MTRVLGEDGPLLEGDFELSLLGDSVVVGDLLFVSPSFTSGPPACGLEVDVSLSLPLAFGSDLGLFLLSLLLSSGLSFSLLSSLLVFVFDDFLSSLLSLLLAFLSVEGLFSLVLDWSVSLLSFFLSDLGLLESLGFLSDLGLFPDSPSFAFRSLRGDFGLLSAASSFLR